jgi:hypothetical protein
MTGLMDLPQYWADEDILINPYLNNTYGLTYGLVLSGAR